MISCSLTRLSTKKFYYERVLSDSHSPALIPFADDGPSHAELTPVVSSFTGAASQTAPQELLESLERYKLVARLGQGGMAEVYLAAWEVAPFVHRPVVIKRLHPHFNQDPRLVQMFLDEARLLCLLEHPHVVKTLEAGVIDGRCCIAMEYLEGQPLHRVLRRAYEHGGLAPHLAVNMAICVLDGLHYSHETTDPHGQALEIVHRDVSPQNVFVTNDGQVKVLDFGIAKAKTQEGRTATGIVKGKVGYIAPEQAAAEAVDRRADVWSTGVLLWEALVGARLFKAETDAATLGLTLRGAVPSIRSRRPDLPEALETVLARALQRDPGLRYQSAAAMRKDLENWLARTGHTREAAPVASLMQSLFAHEITEQQRLVSVLMARSDCTPPMPISSRAPSSTSALIVSSPSAATSADLTRINEQVAALGQRHRRTVRGMWAMLLVFGLVAACVAYLVVGKFSAAQPKQAASGALSTATVTPTPAPVLKVAGSPAGDELDAKPAAFAKGAAKPASARPVANALVVAKAATAPASAAAPALASSKPDAAPSFGFLTIETSPWSLVSVGGRFLGQTPLVNVRLPSGSQILSLKNPEPGIETSYAVSIEAGKTTVRRIGIE